MRDTRLEALLAELRAIQLWDRSEEDVVPPSESVRAGFAARRMRRREIISEIGTLSQKP